MCRTARCSCRCSRRWAPSRRSSPTRRCWSRRRASCRSGSAPTAPSICARRASSRWPAVAAGPDRHVAAGRGDAVLDELATASISRISAARRPISIRTTSSCSTPSCSTISIIADVADRLPEGDRRGGVAGAARQPRPSRRGRGLGAGAPRPDRAAGSRARRQALLERGGAGGRGVDWAGDPWHALTDALKAATGRKGRAVPAAAAGADRPRSGPEMAPLLKLIGKGGARARWRRPPPQASTAGARRQNAACQCYVMM